MPWVALVFLKLSKHKIRQVLETHFGKGTHVCPMGGKIVPELVAGRLEALLEEVFQTAEAELRIARLPNALPPPTNAEWNICIGDFNRAKGAMIALLTLKTDYMKRLPVLSAGLAVADEGAAREVGRRIQRAWAADPRKEVHDDLKGV